MRGSNRQRKCVLALNAAAPPLFLALWASGTSFWIGLGIVFGAHMLVLAGTLIPNSQLLGPVANRFLTSKNEAWLTIDDGPDPLDTPQLLDLLDAAGAKATFFVIGQKAALHPDLIAEIIRRGHSLGNHTLSHPAHIFWRLGPRRLREEIISGAHVLADLGHPTTLFRAPAGMKNPFVHPIVATVGQSIIGWSIRGFDGTDSNPDRILSRLTKGLHPGAILLIHESRPSLSGGRLAPEILSRLLREAAARGLRFAVPHPTSLTPPHARRPPGSC